MLDHSEARQPISRNHGHGRSEYAGCLWRWSWNGKGITIARSDGLGLYFESYRHAGPKLVMKRARDCRGNTSRGPQGIKPALIIPSVKLGPDRFGHNKQNRFVQKRGRSRKYVPPQKWRNLSAEKGRKFRLISMNQTRVENVE